MVTVSLQNTSLQSPLTHLALIIYNLVTYLFNLSFRIGNHTPQKTYLVIWYLKFFLVCSPTVSSQNVVFHHSIYYAMLVTNVATICHHTTLLQYY